MGFQGTNLEPTEQGLTHQYLLPNFFLENQHLAQHSPSVEQASQPHLQPPEDHQEVLSVALPGSGCKRTLGWWSLENLYPKGSYTHYQLC